MTKVSLSHLSCFPMSDPIGRFRFSMTINSGRRDREGPNFFAWITSDDFRSLDVVVVVVVAESGKVWWFVAVSKGHSSVWASFNHADDEDS